MNSIRLRWAIVGLLCCLCIGSIVILSSRRAVLPPSKVSLEDLLITETRPVKGNSENGRRVLTRLHSFYSVYKREHGQYPDAFGDVWTEIKANPNMFGLDKPGDAGKELHNSDWQYADDPMLRNGNLVSFGGYTKRPDGTNKFSPKEPGTKDVLAYTATYVHGGGGDMTGYFQVLWDDGSVEDVPVQKTILLPAKDSKIQNAYDFGFPGQAGLPKDAATYQEKWGKKS